MSESLFICSMRYPLRPPSLKLRGRCPSLHRQRASTGTTRQCMLPCAADSLIRSRSAGRLVGARSESTTAAGTPPPNWGRARGSTATRARTGRSAWASPGAADGSPAAPWAQQRSGPAGPGAGSSKRAARAPRSGDAGCPCGRGSAVEGWDESVRDVCFAVSGGRSCVGAMLWGEGVRLSAHGWSVSKAS